MNSKNSKNALNIFWISFSIILIGIISYLNIKKFVYLNFSDPSSEMFEYIKAIWAEGKLIPHYWRHSNELLIRRNLITAIPIYAITHNLYLTYSINSIITIILIVVSFIFMLNKIGIERKYIPITICIFLSMYSYGDAQTLLFVTQGYANFAIIMFITLAAMSDRLTIISIKMLVFISLLSLYMGICGVKMTLLLYIPLAVVEFIIYFITYLKEKSIKNSYLHHLINTFILLFFNMFGILIYLKCFSKYTSNAYYSFNVLPLTTIIPNLYKQIVALLNSLSIAPIGILKSLITIDSLYKAAVFIVSIGELVYLLKYKQKEKTTYVILVLLSSIIISIISMSMADFRISSRYYFYAPIMFSIIITMFYDQIFKSVYNELKVITFASLVFGILLTCLTYYRQFYIGYIEENKQYQLAEVDYLIDRGNTTVFGSRWNANALSGFSNGILDTANICFGDFKPFEFLTNMSYYQRDKDVIFNLTDSQEDLIYKEELPSKQYLDLARKKLEVGTLNLYYFSKNPLRNFSLPTLKGDKTEFNLSSIESNIVNGKLDVDTGFIVSNYENVDKSDMNRFVDKEYAEWETILKEDIKYPTDVVMYGPDISMDRGQYNFKLDYSVVNSDNNSPGVFEVTSDNMSNIIASTNLMNSKENEINIPIDYDGYKNINFTIKRNKGSQIIIKHIFIEKIN